MYQIVNDQILEAVEMMYALPKGDRDATTLVMLTKNYTAVDHFNLCLYVEGNIKLAISDVLSHL